MEILATVEHKAEFYGPIIFMVGLAVAVSLIIIIVLAQSVKYGKSGYGLVVAISIVLILICGYGTYDTYKTGMPISYKATITDFNDVYENGYVIVGQEGDIYILKKNN